jgi:hypothetical protein
MSRVKAVLVDIDGTLALRQSRSPYDMTKVSEDLPNIPVINLVNILISSGIQIIFVSGRDESARRATLDFLDKYLNTGSPHTLHMRPLGDSRPDENLKLEIYFSQIFPTFEVLFVLDDRDKVVRMWRNEAGLPTFQVADGNF